MHEYRCTFPDKYPYGTVGYANPSGRQGYYVVTASATDAGRQIAVNNSHERITVQYWKPITGVPALHRQGTILIDRSLF